MAKAIIVTHSGEESRFDFTKLERAKVYGSRRRVALDAAGEPCRRASLTQDGRFLLQSGMTAQGYLTPEGRWVSNAELVGLDADGKPLEKQPSTLGVAQALDEVAPRDLFDLRVTSTYALTVQHLEPALQAALDAGKVFRFAFNYRSDYRAETAYLVQNDVGCFAIVGVPALPQWIEPAAAPPPIPPAEEPESDEIDFEMF
ncbi:MAG: hypothetical protein RL562_3195 [Planctomycetota bacterium]|jgi:hypothetical protein